MIFMACWLLKIFQADFYNTAQKIVMSFFKNVEILKTKFIFEHNKLGKKSRMIHEMKSPYCFLEKDNRKPALRFECEWLHKTEIQIVQRLKMARNRGDF